MKKIVRIGTIKTWERRQASVYCRIEFVDGRLSISGVIGPLPSGNCLGGCGQINIEFAHRNSKDNDSRFSEHIQPNEINFAPGWDRERWFDFLDIWKRWHLNDLKAGTPEQEEAVRTWKVKGNEYEYEKACEYLKSINLYEVQLSNGDMYKYGHAWHKELIPNTIIDWLFSLPESDLQPAWI